MRAPDDAFSAGPAAACVVPAATASRLARLRAFIACRPCVAGWALYLVAAILVVALDGARVLP